MPCLNNIMELPRPWHLDLLLEFFVQVLEAVEYMHAMRIAHMDLYVFNVLVSLPRNSEQFPEVPSGAVYIIDFESALHLPQGPGMQHPVELPPSALSSLGRTHFDPYAWDMYCVGKLFDDTIKIVWREKSLPWYVRWFTDWLIGTERGCPGVCHCRPSARLARRVAVAARFVLSKWRGIQGVGSRGLGWVRACSAWIAGGLGYGRQV
ncbi:hypothetical protein OH76DRAFT_1367351 [Lentinus brumalis]|uniref:Protein kinase domain-containing protein n=1 Tax=Lentinus brumalis TaxID=2498619 RepID=A0A371CH34_9APHY|nr:hypothetical protein OH76DRAFT_1367351 [Polyporus brumalis]